MGFNVDTIWINQCMLGSQSTKPTMFLTVNLPSVRREVHMMPNRGRCNHGGHAILEGVDNIGRWKTQAAKQYPPELCMFLARHFVTFACQELRERGE
eukprot:907374-Pyramimonas_sp.AAC.1